MKSLAGMLVLAAALASCAPESGPSAVDVVTARASIDSLWTHFAEAGDRHDAEAFGRLLAEDAVIVYSKAPRAKGRTAAQEFLASRRAGADVTALRVVPDDFKVSDFMATQSGTIEEDYTIDGEEKTETGKFLLVAQRGEDGAWRIRKLFVLVDTALE